MSGLHEECGVFGIYSPESYDIATDTYHALYALQHRGQESCGIAVNDAGVFSSYKDVGLVGEVFTREKLDRIGTGSISIGHVRYATTGHRSRENAQPLVINHIKGSFAVCHNGNLTNTAALREELELGGAIFHTTSDTEVIAYIITKERLAAPSIEEAICSAMSKIKGAYSLVMMSPKKLIAARDPFGFRPLCIGKMGDKYVFASESCALDSIGAEFIRDVEPGELVIVDKNGLRSNRTHCGKEKSALCVFEFLYFARPDSVIDGASVHVARRKAGELLAMEHPIDADVVVGVPDSGLDAARGYAAYSGIECGIGFIKNKYIARTFIQPTQKQREDAVRIKLNPISATVKGKRVVLIDDSIVRGTTARCIVKLLREAGATEVHMLSSAPAFLNPCYFGTDIDSRDNLIACNHTVEETAEIIGADSLGYLSPESVVKIAEGCSRGFCAGCFTGKYPVPEPEARQKYKFEQRIKP